MLGYVELLSDMRWRVNGGDLLGSGIHGDTAQVMELGVEAGFLEVDAEQGGRRFGGEPRGVDR